MRADVEHVSTNIHDRRKRCFEFMRRTDDQRAASLVVRK
jgi:hypothetical protein